MLEQFKKDLISAMKEKDKDAINTLRGVKGALQIEVINTKCCESDELLIDVINKQIKMRKDSIIEFEKANRQDLIESYQKEIDILTKYMPKQLTDEEIDNIIDEAINIVDAKEISDLGKIMKEIMPKVKNKCDMSKLNQQIKSKLN